MLAVVQEAKHNANWQEFISCQIVILEVFMYYISRFIIIDKMDSEDTIYFKIFAPEQNSVVQVNAKLYNLLSELYSIYKNKPLDCDDMRVKTLFNLKSIDIIKKHGFITENPVNLRNKYLNTKNNLKDVYFHVSQECNLRCKYCYASNNLGKNLLMPLDKAKVYVTRLYNIGIRNFIITGGEPLLNPYIDDIIYYIKSKYNDTKVILLTNGTLITSRTKSLLLSDNIIISLDVNGSKNRIGLNEKKLFDDIIALDSNLRYKVIIRSVISKGDEEYILKFKRFFEHIGIKFITIPRLPNCYEDIKFIPDMEKLTQSSIYDINSYRPIKCGAGKVEIAVDWNGDIYPCQNLISSEFLITSLNNPNYKKDLLQSEVISYIDTCNVLNIEECKNCDFKYICGGGCRALSYKVYNKLDKKLDFFCDHFKREALKKLKSVNCVRIN